LEGSPYEVRLAPALKVLWYTSEAPSKENNSTSDPGFVSGGFVDPFQLYPIYKAIH